MQQNTFLRTHAATVRFDAIEAIEEFAIVPGVVEGTTVFLRSGVILHLRGVDREDVEHAVRENYRLAPA